MILQMKFISTAEKSGVLGRTTTDATVAGFVKIIDCILDPIFWTVYFAHCTGHIAVLAEVGKEVRQTVRIGATQAVVPVIVAVLSRQKRDPTRGTNRVLGNGIIKSDALSS